VYVIQEHFAASNLPTTEKTPRLFQPWYLGYRTNRESSVKAATVLSEELGNSLPGWSFPVRTGPVGVLASTIMPAVLIEIGNLNNPASAQALLDDTFQSKFGTTVAGAIERFAPPATGEQMSTIPRHLKIGLILISIAGASRSAISKMWSAAFEAWFVNLRKKRPILCRIDGALVFVRGPAACREGFLPSGLGRVDTVIGAADHIQIQRTHKSAKQLLKLIVDGPVRKNCWEQFRRMRSSRKYSCPKTAFCLWISQARFRSIIRVDGQ
jgi:hypothetical protein